MHTCLLLFVRISLLYFLLSRSKMLR
jgi:hypothetical protein